MSRSFSVVGLTPIPESSQGTPPELTGLGIDRLVGRHTSLRGSPMG
jgi:hypothetical protein